MHRHVTPLIGEFLARTKPARHRRWKLIFGLLSASAAAGFYERNLLLGAGKDVLRMILALKFGGRRAALGVLLPVVMQFVKAKRARKPGLAPRKTKPAPRRA